MIGSNGAVVDDQVQVEVGWRRAADLREELPELVGVMAPGQATEHLPGGTFKAAYGFVVPCRL